MKVYKLSEEEFKKSKNFAIIAGVLFMVVAVINAYLFFMDYSGNVSSVLIFGGIGIAMFKSISNLDRFRFELDGTVLTSYLREDKYYEYDLTKVDVEFNLKTKRSRINIIENDKVVAIFRATDVGAVAFNELIDDVKAIKNM